MRTLDARELGLPMRTCPPTSRPARPGSRTSPSEPNGPHPVLDDDGFVIWSDGVNLYLARKTPRPVAAAWRRGPGLQWSVWAMTELEEPLARARSPLSSPVRATDERKVAEAAGRFPTPLAVLEGALARPWVRGELHGGRPERRRGALVDVARRLHASDAPNDGGLGRCVSRRRPAGTAAGLSDQGETRRRGHATERPCERGLLEVEGRWSTSNDRPRQAWAGARRQGSETVRACGRSSAGWRQDAPA